MSRKGRVRSLAVSFLWLACGPAAAAPPDFTGSWHLDRARSDDVKARIAEVAGPAEMAGGGTSPLTILPMPGTVSSVERVELRDYMMRVAEQLGTLDIEQGPEAIKLFHGEEIARTFYFNREHIRQDLNGRKLKCRTRWQGVQLVLEEDGDKGRRMFELLTLVPAAGLLIEAVRWEDRLLKKPLEVRLVYVRAPEEPKP